MTSGDRAQRALVSIGSLEVEGFQMPDGSYRMSITSAAAAVGTSQQNATNFFRSKAFKALWGRGFTPQEIVPIDASRTRINALPLEVAWEFWLYQCFRSNKQAYSLLRALGSETLERRFDAAFGVQRSEAEYNDLLAQRLQQTEASLERLSEAYAEPDLLREQVGRLEQQIRDMGGKPWQLPPYE
ncbi:hypothetical protein [Pseudanabaena sp. FACHB-2040]|uniref:hypothetical protein n=1 Tax=Pseudanabaena sp. FACHB-2040 TaxID=2692859 RepID=UPI0016832A9C|nr:hypothetical protein [Pseudanabaena sp. FACHB-2040]MBD2261092.1 hypothetical protein [Pseudanabaena sp. FACHB-2040]